MNRMNAGSRSRSRSEQTSFSSFQESEGLLKKNKRSDDYSFIYSFTLFIIFCIYYFLFIKMHI